MSKKEDVWVTKEELNEHIESFGQPKYVKQQQVAVRKSEMNEAVSSVTCGCVGCKRNKGLHEQGI